ncbi:CLAVATA3/ESR (CLE)-related protein 12-like [Impatiens glandulifera]|uniref:CLAVATA3/ESR (CLE)-related protein 12-like n=1 Tax=Impatiens glandulifera TaxID=253017 RepID=UPI001FB17073|nr:CLAVATA3/ESR (CLE)-related protein 12-like [Impatiens glandulifera]
MPVLDSPRRPILWICLFLLLFLELRYLVVVTPPPASTHSSPPPAKVKNRKTLASEFDFSPFMNANRRSTDLIYGDDKRLVPSGPNPLHH